MPPQPVAIAQQAGQPADQLGLYVAGEQFPDLTRYSVTLSNPAKSTLSDLQVAVQLPDDAVFDHALETPGFTQFMGPHGQTLTWRGATIAPDDIVDPFTFFLAQPPSGSFNVSATWNGDSAGQVQSEVQPAVQTATDTEADVTIDATTLAQGFAPIGNTGVIIAAVSGQIPVGTTLHVRVLDAESNPAAAAGDLWWCSMVQVDGLPAGAGLLLSVPARQPLPPEASIELFGQRGAGWTALPDTANVSGDGQSILYVHRGGVIAAGTASSNQPRLASGLVLSPLVGIGASSVQRQIQASRILLAVQQQELAQLMVQPAHCPPGNCAGLPPCFSSQLVAGNICANGSIRSQDVSAQGIAGRTLCQRGGGPCTGFVGLLPGGASAPAGHGTFCRFDSFTQPTGHGFSCSSF